MLMPREGGRDEAQKLHRKWMKHQAFMAELARNKEWLAKIEQHLWDAGLKLDQYLLNQLKGLLSVSAQLQTHFTADAQISRLSTLL
ncbi:spectrin beta chain, non-erythrocytic 4 [Tachysurus ichikawai]